MIVHSFSDRSDFAVFQSSVYAPYLKCWLLESWLRHIQVFTQAVTVSSDTNWFVMCKGNNLENTCLAESVTRWLQWQSWTARVDFINIQGKISHTEWVLEWYFLFNTDKCWIQKYTRISLICSLVFILHLQIKGKTLFTARTECSKIYWISIIL